MTEAAQDSWCALRLRISGRVQGVGFRPCIYNLALEAGLVGAVRNTGGGVVVEIEGHRTNLDSFVRALPARVPALAHISSLEREEIPADGRTGFEILPSTVEADSGVALIPYDVATCDACLAEVRDPTDRRFAYPFTNCTLCGPRYTIIQAVPYDRHQTSMRDFSLCAECQHEYQDPSDRRYHAQPNACPRCGPQVELVDPQGGVVPGEPLVEARDLLRAGRILGVRGIGGFHLAVDASDQGAVDRLRRRKKRGAKPFAVMAPDLSRVESFAQVSGEEARLLSSPRRPIVLLDRREPFRLAEAVAPGNPRVGVMLPYSPLHHLLLDGFDALVLTSGNLAEEPIVRRNDEALERLAGIADGFLFHDREILMACDDSVAAVSAEGVALVRRSRGYAPDPVALPGVEDGILAVGAHLKNTFCLTRGGQAFLSQHVGDLENLVTFEHFERCLAHLEDLLSTKPRVVACDLHPDYLSSQFAARLEGLRLVRVQHHHAHLASCMADRGLEGPVIGLCLDGTGLGDDGTIWGGEVLVGDRERAQRVARLSPFPLPGGDAAVREPWRSAVGLLLSQLGSQATCDLAPVILGRKAALIGDVAAAGSRGVNAPLTSSLGRLFDAVAALLGIRDRIDFDGQAAVELEAAAALARGRPWEMLPVDHQGLLDLDLRPLVDGILEGLDRGVPVPELAAGFHSTVIQGLVAACEVVRERGGPARVVLSGGCMLNRQLDGGLREELVARGFEVFGHRQVPANDGGLCLGQAAVAGARISS